MSYISRDSDAGCDTASPTIPRRSHSTPTAPEHAVSESQNGPDYTRSYQTHREPRSSSLPESTSSSWAPCANLTTQLSAPLVIPNNLPIGNQNDRQLSQSLLSASPSLWHEDPPLLPPPHTFGKSIPLPPVDDSDFLPIEDSDTDSRPRLARPLTNAARIAPSGSPRPALPHGDNGSVGSVGYEQHPFLTPSPSGAATRVRFGIFNRRVVCDCNVTAPDFHICPDGAIKDIQTAVRFI